MQKESMHISTSVHVTHDQAITKELLAKPVECSHCAHVFKSKVLLFEHLNIDHGFDVDAALRGAGLKYAGTNKDKADDSSKGEGVIFQCQHCAFKESSLDVLNHHLKICRMNLNNSEKTVIETSQYEEGGGAKDIASVPSVMSTSKTKSTLNSSKDLKTYKRPFQTIAQYFKPSSRSKGKPSVKLADSPVPLDCRGTLILQESPSSSCPNSSGVFQVTAKPTIDLSTFSTRPHCSLQIDELQIKDLRSAKPKEPLKETTPDDIATRAKKEVPSGPPAKKAKTDKADLRVFEKANPSKQQSLSSTEFSFEFSEDDEEKICELVDRDPESSNIFFCKHCDYSNDTFKRLSNHYLNSHPYVRHNSDYIKYPSDQSATFRCLDCPVEFPSVADLKRHYSENHPEAQNIFTTPSRELSLVFRCFVCPFTISTSNTLKKHYVEKHPTHIVENPLMYYTYSASKCQQGSLSLNTNETEPIPERLGEISPQGARSPFEEVKTTANRPTSEPADVGIYQCMNCAFTHKSVVVMHVHYQKSHPGEAVTIDKIKQSARATSPTATQTSESPNSVTTIETSPRTSNSPEETSDKAERSPQKKIILCLRKTKHAPEDSENHMESPDIKKVASAEDRSEGENTPTKQSREVSPEAGGLSYNSPVTLFYCQYCHYSSPNIRSVVGHRNAKHTGRGLTSFADVLRYNEELQKRKLVSGSKPSTSTTPSESKRSKLAEVSCAKERLHDEDKPSAAPGMSFGTYACAESMFFCEMCNYGNPTVKGVYTHQSKVHPSFPYSNNRIVEYSTVVREKIRKCDSQAKELPFLTDLPLPFINEGDEHLYFCHICNFRQKTAWKVVQHSGKRHKRLLVSIEQVRKYTAMVLKETPTSCPETTPNQEVRHASVTDKENQKKKKQLGKVSVLHSLRASQTQRVLQCHRCPYNTQFVYLLRRHLKKSHGSNRTIQEVLGLCFKQGSLETGYHCDLCVFSHNEVTTLFKHYRKHHPARRLSLEYMTERLYVSPDTCPLLRKKPIKHAGVDEHGDGSHGSLPSPRSGQNEHNTYSCRACSYKGASFSSIACHYRAVHPWSVKEDGSVLDVINGSRLSANRHPEEEDHDTLGSFDAYQVPLEFDCSTGSPKETAGSMDSPPRSSRGATPSTKLFRCSYCSARFDTQRGLNTHVGIKHPEAGIFDELQQAQKQVRSKSRVHVFKCPHCTYVNTSYQGVLTHCHRRHPDLAARVESVHIDDSRLNNSGNCMKSGGPGLRFGGYMCDTCPRIYATQEKLNKHSRIDHNEMVPNTLKPPAANQMKLSETAWNQSSISKASFLSKKMYSLVRCQQCSYSCTTKHALERHVRIRHKTVSLSKAEDRSHKCVLCSSSYIMKKPLGNHYIKVHGEESFLKYFAPMYKKASKWPKQKPMKVEGNNIVVYRCPNCPYVNASMHGILTHCQMKHPDFLARANEIETEEILQSNMVGCKMGKGSNQRGYTCRECPQIHLSMKKLRCHCERDHSQAKEVASEHSTEIPKQPVNISKGPGHQSGQPGTFPSKTPSVQNKEFPYKCQMCLYAGEFRKYLHRHYRKVHKLDSSTTSDMLLMYNKCNWEKPLSETVADDGEPVKCKICLNVFDSSQLLIAHYSTIHMSDRILNFTILSKASKKSTGLYKCSLCNKQMNGIRKLCYHLDCHRALEKIKAAKTEALASKTTSDIETRTQDELPILENVEPLAQWWVVPKETFTLPSGPSSPLKPSDEEQTEPGSTEDIRSCKQCRRTFRSLRGLRTHERSHAAMAAIEKLPNSALEHDINKHVLYKHGTTRPFLCSFCPFRTTVMGLWRVHFMKNHQDVLMDTAEMGNKDEERLGHEDTPDSEDQNSWPEIDEEPEVAERSMYLEPPDVQRQLDHYSSMAKSGAASKANAQHTDSSKSNQLHCEYCSFSTGNLRNMKRHYLNRYGKRIHTCKDCNFFTGSRKTLEKHVQMGHSTCQSEPTHQKDLRCPFCLYQTKNKNNMIDHIDLHRDERVVPIEVRRPKLSRYLQGIVLRCHKCTFTCGSAENLRLHLTRHADIKPFRCRLCYFDCTRLSDLEAHLSDKHQVLRNHELVGQVRLDQLEKRENGMAEEEPLCDNSDSEEVKTEGFVTDYHEVPHETQAKNKADNNIQEKITLKIKLANPKQGQDGGENGNGEISAKNSESAIQYDNAKPNAAVQEKQDPQEQVGIVLLPDTARGSKRKNPFGQSVEEGIDADMQLEDRSFPEKQRQTDEGQPKLREDGLVTLTPQEEGAAEGSSTTHDGMAEKTPNHKLHIKAFQQRMMKIKAMAQDDKTSHIPLDVDGNIIKTRGADGGRPVGQMNQITTEATSNKNHMLKTNTKGQKRFTVERHLLKLPPNCTLLKLTPNENVRILFKNCKREGQAHRQKSTENATDTFGEMPILEDERLRGESGRAGEHQKDPVKKNQDKDGEAGEEDDESRRTKRKDATDGIKESDNPHVPEDGAAVVPLPSATEDKLFTCEFCGRSLTNGSDLKRHVMRHGL